MSLIYDPSPGAELDAHWTTVYLSTRDAGARIPIDFGTHPGVHLTRACFSNGVYDDIPAQTCISNLLASQFRRIIVDLYWDNINRQFNFCPVELPPLTGNSTSGYSVDASAVASITATTSSDPGALASTPSDGAVEDALLFGKRQVTGGNSTTNLDSSTASSTASDASIPTSTGVAGTELMELGPYKCSVDLNLGSIMSLYEDFFDQTSTTIHAQIHYLTINLHAASPFTAPSQPANAPMHARLPQADELIGVQFQSALPEELYSPAELQYDRANLNKSWFRDDYQMKTDTSYFQTSSEGDRVTTTQDGWPGAEWVVLTDHRRLILGWGQVDPQMEAYNFQGDADNVFPPGHLGSGHAVAVGNAGDVVSGCFHEPGETTIQRVNSSWAFAVANQTNPAALYQLAQNLTACGISPILNVSLGNLAAQDNLGIYQKFARSAVFGWAPGEPRNVSESNEASTDSQTDYGCAVVDSTSSYRGRWRREKCQNKHRVACRIADEPYAWRLSTIEVPFDAAYAACPASTKFDLPRTGLENTYLARQIVNTSTDSDDANSILSGVWIDFNSLDQDNCWVTGGPNATCPYNGDDAEEQAQREVLIPTIAALIVLILTVLTLLVKCNENRRNSRTRRRGDNGWEYEGVPS